MSETPVVLVRMSPELVRALREGRHGLPWEFGEQDADGFYEPVIRVDRSPSEAPLPRHDGRHGTTCLVCFPVTADEKS
jgi:hypothetical protein